jgi:hypothetical protein
VRERRRQQKPLWRFGLAAAVLLILALGAVAGWVVQTAVANSRQTLIDEVQQANMVSARLAANVFEERVRFRVSRLQEQSKLPELAEALERGDRDALYDFLKSIDNRPGRPTFTRGYYRYFIADAQGVVLAIYERGVPKADLVPLLGENFSWRDWYHGQGDQRPGALNVLPPLRDMHISQPFMPKNPTPQLSVSVTAPVFSGPAKNGEVLGMLVGMMKVSTLSTWLRGVVKQERFAAVYNERGQCLLHKPRPDGAEGVVIDGGGTSMPQDAEDETAGSGDELAPSPPPLAPGENPHSVFAACPAIETAVKATSDGVTEFVDPWDRVTYLAGYAVFREPELAKLVPHNRWAVLVQTEARAALQPVNRLQSQLVWVGLMVLIGGSLVMIGLCTWLWRTLRRDLAAACGLATRPGAPLPAGGARG